MGAEAVSEPQSIASLDDAEPERLRELPARLDACTEDVDPRHFPVRTEGPIPIDRTSADPYRPGEEFAYWLNEAVAGSRAFFASRSRSRVRAARKKWTDAHRLLATTTSSA